MNNLNMHKLQNDFHYPIHFHIFPGKAINTVRHSFSFLSFLCYFPSPKPRCKLGKRERTIRKPESNREHFLIEWRIFGNLISLPVFFHSILIRRFKWGTRHPKARIKQRKVREKPRNSKSTESAVDLYTYIPIVRRSWRCWRMEESSLRKRWSGLVVWWGCAETKRASRSRSAPRRTSAMRRAAWAKRSIASATCFGGASAVDSAEVGLRAAWVCCCCCCISVSPRFPWASQLLLGHDLGKTFYFIF